MRKRLHSLQDRMERSRRWQERYRTDAEFRLAKVNASRRHAGLPPVTSMPPVGEAKRVYASGRQRDGNGRFISEDRA